MSDDFRSKFGLIDQDDDKTYRAWRTCQQGATMYIKLVPAKGLDQSTWFIPYLQTISLQLNEDASTLCLLCHSTGMTIFIEGTEMEDLAAQISDKRVKSIHVFDPASHTKTNEHTATVTKITVESSPQL